MMRKALTYAIGWAPQMLADIVESQLGTAMMGLFVLSMAGSQGDWIMQLQKIDDLHSYLQTIAPQLKALNPALAPIIDIQIKVTSKVRQALEAISFYKPTPAEEDEYPTLPSNPDQWFQGPIR